MKNILRVGLAGFVTLLALAVLRAPQTIAAPADVTFTVDTSADLIDADTTNGTCLPGSCSLRAAIMQANVLQGPGVTIIVPSGTYTLTRPQAGANGADNGDLNLLAPPSGSNTIITISGAGAGTTRVNANKIDRVLSVEALRTAVISGVTLSNGYRVINSGSVIPKSGGGVYNDGNLTIIDSVIEGSESNGRGGGIFTLGTLDLRRSTLRSNIASGGGGLYVQEGTAVIRDSTLSGNHADDGGGILINTSSETQALIVVNSTISGNYADTNGGGIYNAATTFVYNTSVIDNDADHDHDELGGIGGGVLAYPGSRFVVVNTLIARNTAISGVNDNDCDGTLELYGWNLLGTLDDGCSFTGNGISARGLVSLNSIGPLHDNGGPTQTNALLAGSEAIDSTYPLGCTNETDAPLTTDQRGAARGVGTACDIGAFEYIPLRHLYLPSITR
ncbi:MAG: choice-of-anchor Q domain-containing protein [Anaerolineales bacterium]